MRTIHSRAGPRSGAEEMNDTNIDGGLGCTTQDGGGHRPMGAEDIGGMGDGYLHGTKA